VRATLRAGAPPPVTPDDARHTLALVAGGYAPPVTPEDRNQDSPCHDGVSGGISP
jgi:hypothetical protein